MATYYSGWTNIKNQTCKIRLKLITSSTQNVSANTSSVTLKQYVEVKDLYAYLPGSPSGVTENHKEKLNGTTYTSSAEKEYYKDGSYLIQSHSKTVSHNSLGEANITISGSCEGVLVDDNGEGHEFKLSIPTKTIALPTINRASNITSNATKSAPKDIGTNVTFTISRYSSSYTHTLKYKVGDTTYTIGTNVGTSTNYTFPISLVEQFTKTDKPQITVTCYTYVDNKLVGSKDTIVYLQIPASYVPTIDLTLQEANPTMINLNWKDSSNNPIYVQSISQIQGTIIANGSGGSTIVNYNANGNNQAFNTTPFTTGLLINSGSVNFAANVLDSRGRSASINKSIDVNPYTPPKIVSYTAYRCNASGVRDEYGTYANLVVTYDIESIDNHNAKTISVVFGDTIKTKTLSNYDGTIDFTNDLFEGLDISGTHQFTIRLIDTFNSSEENFSILPSFVTRSWYNGGKGVTFGRTATEEGLNSYMDANFYANNYFKNTNVSGLKTEKFQGGWITYVEDEA